MSAEITFEDFLRVDIRVGRVVDVLVLGLPDADGNVVLVQPQADVPLGGRLF